VAYTVGDRLAAQICKSAMGVDEDCIGHRNILRVGAVDIASPNALFELCVVCIRDYLCSEVFYSAQASVGKFTL